METVRPVAKQAWATFEQRSARQTSKQTQRNDKEPSRENLGGFCA
jgi:hypothetical protein